MEVKARRDFVRVGETLEHACLLAEGLVSRFGQTEDGKRQYVAIYVPGEMVDLPSVMVPTSATSLSALADSLILRIPHKQMREISVRYPAVAAAFWRDCVLDGAIVAQWLVNVGRRDARSRIAHLLCELAVRYRAMDQSDGLAYELPMTQEQMADALGLTPVHTNRMLQALRADGLIVINRSRVQIHDWQALAAAGDFDAIYLQAAPLIDQPVRSPSSTSSTLR
jgi:CRP-like cAMP-binding protein